MKFFDIYAICVSLILTFFPSLIFALDPQIEDGINRFITETFMPLNNIPGLGLSVFRADNGNGEENMLSGYGFRNLENGLPVNPSTLFGIGSISKSFVALLVVKTLSEEFPLFGERALDMPIQKLLPNHNFTLIDRFRSKTVTFRDLLSHRLCLLPDFLGFSTGPFKDKAEFLYRQRYAPEICSFRSAWNYNNGAFGIASELIAEIARSTFENLLSQLFTDIGMTESSYIQESVDYDQKANMSTAYYRNGTTTMKYNSELLKRVHVAAGAGGVLSTPNDMLKYIKLKLNNGRVGDRQIISEEAMSWLGKSAIPVPFNGWKTQSNIAIGDFGYGLGYFIGTHDGYERISHGGFIPPYLSFLSFYPALKLGIFSTINGPGRLDRSSDLEVLHIQVFNILMGKNISEITVQENKGFKMSKAKSSKFFELAHTKIENQFPSPNQYAGIYGNGLSGELRITEVDGSSTGELYIRYGKWGTGYLKPITNTTYQIEWDSDLVQEEYIYGPIPIPSPVLDFSQPNTVVLNVIDGSQVIFEKDLTLDKLPIQPWDPDSCGPSSTHIE